MTDPAERLRRVRALFDAVADLAPSERAAALERLAVDDIALQREVTALVAADATTAAALHSPFAPGDMWHRSDAAALVGQRLGPYDVVGLIGMGGMGAVYEGARADDQYRKRVAIKLVQRGFDSELTLARFRRERQILASLEHRNIATLLDGGVTPDGRPFLVMEYVDGAPITAWCNAHHLGVRERVALFRQVCHAVTHAHQNLVIHRDIKPGNILVTADGRVKLLDFGIAKLLDAASGDDAMPLTRGGTRAFTPEYASPEQIRGDALTTASDVYGLGVVLFEVLTGRRPYLVSSRALVDIERAVLEEPVPRPSAVVTAELAELHGEGTVDRLRRRLQGELDNIVLTALRLEPVARYHSADALDEDLGRYLAGLPVRAHGAWVGYRLRKFVRRNAAAVVASVLVCVALVGGTIATVVQSRRAEEARLQEAQVNSFLRDLLSSVQPETGSRDARVSQVLDAAARRLPQELMGQPRVRAELEALIGGSYSGLGRYDEAETHFRAALRLHQQSSGPRSPGTVLALSNLGQLYLAKGALDTAESYFMQALSLHTLGSRRPDTVQAALLANLGSLAHSRGRPVDAERYHRQVLAIRRGLMGDHDDLVAQSINDVGVAVGEQGRMEEAESLARVSLALFRGNHPGPNARVAGALNALAGVLDFEGKVAPAESAYVETLALKKQVLGAEHPEYALTLFNYSFLVFDQKRYPEAAAIARELLALRDKSLPESHPAIAGALQTLGRSLDRLGDPAGGEQALLESLALRRKYLGPDSWLAASSEGMLGEHYLFLKQYPKAEETLLHAQGLFVKALGESNPRTLANTRRLVALYDAWPRPAKAAEYRARIPLTTQ
ncbi:MAG: serine/threonine-protein kinase [Gemmatimonadales bacterium]